MFDFRNRILNWKESETHFTIFEIYIMNFYIFFFWGGKITITKLKFCQLLQNYHFSSSVHCQLLQMQNVFDGI